MVGSWAFDVVEKLDLKRWGGLEGGGQGIRRGVRGVGLALISPALICVGPCTRIYLPGLRLLFVNWVQLFPVRVTLSIEGPPSTCPLPAQQHGPGKYQVGGHKSCHGGGCHWCLLSLSGQNLPLFTLC